jgi:hypothetical protein
VYVCWVYDVVILVAFSNEEVSEELVKVRIVGVIVKAESTSVVKEDAKLVGKTAGVPNEARRRARLRSCSRIIDVAPERCVRRDNVRRLISWMRERLNSPLRWRK